MNHLLNLRIIHSIKLKFLLILFSKKDKRFFFLFLNFDFLLLLLSHIIDLIISGLLTILRKNKHNQFLKTKQDLMLTIDTLATERACSLWHHPIPLDFSVAKFKIIIFISILFNLKTNIRGFTAAARKASPSMFVLKEF